MFLLRRRSMNRQADCDAPVAAPCTGLVLHRRPQCVDRVRLLAISCPSVWFLSPVRPPVPPLRRGPDSFGFTLKLLQAHCVVLAVVLRFISVVSRGFVNPVRLTYFTRLSFAARSRFRFRAYYSSRFPAFSG